MNLESLLLKRPRKIEREQLLQEIKELDNCISASSASASSVFASSIHTSGKSDEILSICLMESMKGSLFNFIVPALSLASEERCLQKKHRRNVQEWLW